MDKTVLQINFIFEMSPTKYTEIVKPLAEPIAASEGLLWKVWLMDEENSMAGGVYLFDSLDSAQAFLAGPIVTGVGQHPQIKDISVKVSGIDSELSAITRGPIESIIA